MTKLSKDAFITRFNDAVAGLYRAGQVLGIDSSDHRKLVQDLEDSVLFLEDLDEGIWKSLYADFKTTAELPDCTYTLGTTLTSDEAGVLTIDGTAITAGMSVIVSFETDTQTNGVYTCIQTGTVGGQWILRRRDDSNNGFKLYKAIYYVSEGTVNAGTYWRQEEDTRAGIVAVSFAPFSAGLPKFSDLTAIVLASGDGLAYTGTFATPIPGGGNYGDNPRLFIFYMASPNTGPVTVNIDGVGAFSIKKVVDDDEEPHVDLEAGDIGWGTILVCHFATLYFVCSASLLSGASGGGGSGVSQYLNDYEDIESEGFPTDEMEIGTGEEGALVPGDRWRIKLDDPEVPYVDGDLTINEGFVIEYAGSGRWNIHMAFTHTVT